MLPILGLMIPILALSIPIVAILAGTYAKTHQTDPGQAEKLKRLEQRIRSLEESFNVMQEDVLKLEDQNRFLTKLLDDKSGTN